jgi:enamine deaminase RidA (YjgF/YER057c/UK114 family)
LCVTTTDYISQFYAFVLSNLEAGLVELVERKIKDGSIKPQQFWNVVNEHMPAESAPEPKEHARGNIKPNGPMAPPLMSPPLMSPPIPGMGPPIYAPPPPGSYRPYPYHYPRPVPPPIQLPIAPPIPPHAPEIQLYKYNFKTPSDIWNANKMGYPIGILVGGPSSPHGVSGTFYSSGLVAMTSDGIIRSTARDQVQFLFANLKTILKIMSASITDILNMTIYVKDIQLNGKEVKEEEEAFLGNSLGVTNNLVKTVGVTSLMEGAMVLVKVSVMVRRAHPGCFELQRIR